MATQTSDFPLFKTQGGEEIFYLVVPEGSVVAFSYNGGTCIATKVQTLPSNVVEVTGANRWHDLAHRVGTALADSLESKERMALWKQASESPGEFAHHTAIRLQGD